MTEHAWHGCRELIIEFPGSLQSSAIDELCGQVGGILAADASVVLVCDLNAVAAPDLALIDALAHLRLIARRHGIPMIIRHACAMACGLIDLVGLHDTLQHSSHTEIRRADRALPHSEGGASE